MPKGRLKIHCVVVPSAVTSHVEHPRAPQITDQTPNRPLRQGHLVRDLTDRALRIGGDVEENRAVAGY